MSQQPDEQKNGSNQSKESTNKNNGYEVRELRKDDFDKGFLDLLSQLSKVGNVDKEMFNKAFDNLSKNKKIFVIESKPNTSNNKNTSNDDTNTNDKDKNNNDNNNNNNSNTTIVGSAAIIIEQKFLHSCQCVGHIEDVVVSSSVRKQGIGKLLIEHCVNYAQSNNSYKVILDCSRKNIPFYNKCGFVEKETEMAYYFPKQSQ